MAKRPSPNLLLQRERMRHFLTQSELAEIIGVATKTVQRWELGLSTPRAYYMHKLCDYFGKTPEALGFSEGAQAEEEDGWTSGQAGAPASTNGHRLQRFLLYLLVTGVVVISIIVAWIILRPSW
jgi:DNA-binding XRE family transcriptional regulator